MSRSILPMRPAACLLVTALAVLTASCGSVYQRDFRQAVADAKGVYNDPTGPWQGRWTSEPTGHEGPVWCMISEHPGKPDTYDFRYRAGWGLINFGDYVHTTKVSKAPDGSIRLKSSMELPEAFGTYTVDGTVTSKAFDARHSSDKGDRGTMALRRPE